MKLPPVLLRNAHLRISIPVLKGIGYRVVLVVICSLFIIGFATAQPNNGLVAYYPFSGNAADSSGNHHDGTITGGVTLTADRFGNPNSAYHFDGSSGYILCPNDSALLESKDLSYSVWFRVQNRSSWQQNVILANIGGYLNSGGFEAFIGNPPGVYASMFRNGTHLDQQLNGDTIIKPDVWYQLLVVLRYDSIGDSTTVTNYINCSFDVSKKFAGSINYDAINRFYIGANQDISCCQRYFKGDIDEVKVYDVAINPCGVLYSTDTVNIACGDSFSFGGRTYYLPVTVAHTFTSSKGQDSIVTLHLNVTNSINLIQALCPNDSILFYGTWIHNYGVYDTLIHTPNACDSLITLSLPVVDPPPPFFVYDSICDGDSLLFNGTYLKAEGTYYAHYKPQQGCDSAVTLNLTVINIEAATVEPPSALICANDSVRLCTDTALAYNWNTGSTSSCIYVSGAGSYYVTVTYINGCSIESDHIDVNVYPVPSVSITISGDTFVVFNANRCQWLLNGQIIGGATGSFYIATTAGMYTVQVTDSNGCIATSSGITYTGIKNRERDKMEVYPNPATGNKLVIKVPQDLVGNEVELYDPEGKRLAVLKLANRNSDIDISGLSNGMYFVKILTGGTLQIQDRFSIVR